jgi:hypothetical protein
LPRTGTTSPLALSDTQALRCMVLKLTGTHPGGAYAVHCPTNKKIYVVWNSTAGDGAETFAAGIAARSSTRTRRMPRSPILDHLSRQEDLTMAWGSDTAATQLAGITTEPFFNQIRRSIDARRRTCRCRSTSRAPRPITRLLRSTPRSMIPQRSGTSSR